MRELIHYITGFVPILFSGLTLSATLLFLPDFKHYRRIFKTLKHRRFVKINNVVFAFTEDEKHDVIDDNNVIMWCMETNGFVLSENVYLINSVITCFCPYSFYWLIRYQLFFKRLIKTNEFKKTTTLPKK